MPLPMVAIVGRPNVGKSTLFNRIARRRKALVEDLPGVTRDRNYADTDWAGRFFTVIDTGGFVPGDDDVMLSQVREQAQLAVEEAEVVLLVTDGRAGLTPVDTDIAQLLRRSGKPVVIAVNKVDSPSAMQQALVADFLSLGFDEVHAISAEHALGTQDLLDAVTARMPPPDGDEQARINADRLEDGDDDDVPMVAGDEEEGDFDELPEELPSEPERPIRLAIIGRPNVGKSTLVNALLGEERVVASDIPGTTRDAIDSALSWKERNFVLTDTAGIRRRKTIAHRVEKYAVVSALKAVDRSDIAVLLLDATEPAVDQDAKLAGVADEKGRALIIVVNKWDLVEKDAKTEAAYRAGLKERLRFVSYAPVVFTSALTGAKVQKVLEVAAELADQYRFRAPTPMLNRLLQHVTEHHPMPIVDGRPLRLYYAAQVGVAPPTFLFRSNRPGKVPDPYRRYLSNQLRTTFNLKVPMRLYFRDRPGQAKRVARKRLSKIKWRPKRRD
ncbi:MAG TPA: ribosome biogenesis GTPase Der [Myxococcaceae bacterium]|nr:ribosome biogenesis GTPase Der [Myxococcaceae bacterium]